MKTTSTPTTKNAAAATTEKRLQNEVAIRIFIKNDNNYAIQKPKIAFMNWTLFGPIK